MRIHDYKITSSTSEIRTNHSGLSTTVRIARGTTLQYWVTQSRSWCAPKPVETKCNNHKCERSDHAKDIQTMSAYLVEVCFLWKSWKGLVTGCWEAWVSSTWYTEKSPQIWLEVSHAWWSTPSSKSSTSKHQYEHLISSIYRDLAREITRISKFNMAANY